MKKLNRKGFTLVELLAVIIILAIVVGITIPAITDTINDSKNNALGVAVDTAADYISDQYAIMNVDYNSASANFRSKFTGPTTSAVALKFPSNAALLEEMGFISDNVAEVTVTIKQNGQSCVTVTKIKNTGEYYSTKHWNTPSNGESTPKNTASNKSRFCS